MKEKLSSDVLLKRSLLPEKPNEVRLEGRYVILKPLDVERDAKPLYDVSCGKQINLGSKLHAAYDEDAPDLALYV